MAPDHPFALEAVEGAPQQAATDPQAPDQFALGRDPVAGRIGAGGQKALYRSYGGFALGWFQSVQHGAGPRKLINQFRQ